MSFVADEPIPLDTPIFINANTIIFRSGMSDIYILDLKKGIAGSITSSKMELSKPIFTNGILSYGVYDSDGETVNLDFYVVNIQ
ncbi:hypothetical protein ACE38V_18010 [Cytobacillus sp. Hz8]|uniref:hypothetical protein n=1 Tax=Cytobacillus sp. Hz8 TaxID=3347168 RepID=UPI0035DE5735